MLFEKCKYCHETVKGDADKCPHCNHILKKSNISQKKVETEKKETKDLSMVTPYIPVMQKIKSSTQSTFSLENIFRFLIAVAIIVGFTIYNAPNEKATEINNEAVSNLVSGDSQEIINQLKSALNIAKDEDLKVVTLINLGYAYSNALQPEQALKAFKDALIYTQKDAYEYFLISGEIALLEKNPSFAEIYYNKAYALKPDDFQINNALASFYLDLEDIAPSYVDYPKALKYMQKAYDESESSIKELTQQNLAIAFFFNENYTQTISLLSPLPSADFDKNPSLYLYLGLAYHVSGDDVSAKTYLQKAIDRGIEVPEEFLTSI